VASANNALINSPYAKSNVSNTLDYNLYYAPGGVTKGQFTWNGQPDGSFYTFSQYRNATKEDAHSLFGNPQFVNAAAANFHLTASGPAIDAGGSKEGWYAPVDFAGTTRDLPPEIGAYEREAKSSDGSHLVYQSLGANSAQNPAFGSSPQSWQPLDVFLMAEALLATDALSWCWHTLDAFLMAEWPLPTDALFLFTGLENVWSL